MGLGLPLGANRDPDIPAASWNAAFSRAFAAAANPSLNSTPTWGASRSEAIHLDDHRPAAPEEGSRLRRPSLTYRQIIEEPAAVVGTLRALL
jgi:hypothetical protein